MRICPSKPCRETAAERVRHRIRHDLEVGSSERDHPEAEDEQGEENSREPCASLEHHPPQRGCSLCSGGHCLETLHRPGDLTAEQANPTADGEHVTDDDPTAMHADVAVEGHEVALHSPMHFGLAIDDHEVPRDDFTRPDRRAPDSGPATFHIEARGRDGAAQCRAEVTLETRWIVESARVDMGGLRVALYGLRHGRAERLDHREQVTQSVGYRSDRAIRCGRDRRSGKQDANQENEPAQRPATTSHRPPARRGVDAAR